ncbi:MAG: phosphoesterase [Planctomycetota bacterium]|nr:MAG: phosphoesterase [Planctomycetota bacterium]
MRAAWATDIHLNFVGTSAASAFCRDIAESGCEALLLGGDIAEAGSLERWLRFVTDALQLPVYFVLGNHDYYGGSLVELRGRMRRLSLPGLHWLSAAGVVELAHHTALVGHGGWGDARIGDFAESEVVLNDYVVIDELRSAGSADTISVQADPMWGWNHKPELAATLGALGDEAAMSLRPHLIAALESHPRVIVLTHVPPFREACWHEGAISDDDWLPGFTCQAMGDMLREVVGSHPEREVTVLCGHTHSEGRCDPLPNLHVRTGRARYGQPGFELLQLGQG